MNGTREALGLEPYTDFEPGDGRRGDGRGAARGVRRCGRDRPLDRRAVGGAGAGRASSGPTFAAIIARQFEALRDGDRLWYENAGFDAETLAEIKDTSLSDLILRHTDTQYLQDDVFTFHERRDAETEAEHPEFPQLVVGTADGQTLEGGAADDILAGRDGDQDAAR